MQACTTSRLLRCCICTAASLQSLTAVGKHQEEPTVTTNISSLSLLRVHVQPPCRLGGSTKHVVLAHCGLSLAAG